MSKNQERAHQLRSGQSSGADDVTEDFTGWSKPISRLASLSILGYLFILILGPLSNPVASPYLSGPIAAKISPIQRALFLGHGYRFFGPDPGPGHLLVFTGQRADGSQFEGVFPDSSQLWPRLLYHRWFMLSETVFNEHALQLSLPEFQQRADEYERQIAAHQEAGKLQFAKELIQERDLEALQFEESRRRVELLGNGIANVLAERNKASSIKLFLRIRQIPLAEIVASGVSIDDPELLSELLPFGELDSSGYRALSPHLIGQGSLPINNTEEILPAAEASQ